jgi:UDP-N-acetylglucosamine--N-acetylmuramyl-(pentapeptide) pyrophosphoryl-undecaprenol N-acetylglucosamine transferase
MESAVKPLLKDFKGEYRCIDYTEDIASYYAVADLTIARAGASTLAEITARGIPAILVPYPYAADNHQEKNARLIERIGGAYVILDKDVEDNLGKAVIKIALDKDWRDSLANKSKSLGKPDALKVIVDEIENLFLK